MPAISISRQSSVGLSTAIYTVPAGKNATINIRVANTSATSEKCSLSISSGAPALKDFIENGVTVTQQKPLLNTGEVLGPNESVYVTAESTNLAIRISGFEEEQ